MYNLIGSIAMDNLKIDLGCGSCKKEGTIGVDIEPHPCVDHVLDIQKEALPFADRSVNYVYSSHFLEHIDNPLLVFMELSRVCKDGAELEFWTPYGWSNPAFIFSHKIFYNEDHYLHLCVWHSDHWKDFLKANWILKEFTYIIEPEVLTELYNNKIGLDFALKYYKGVVKEFGVSIEIRHGYEGAISPPKRTFAVDRYAQRHPVKSLQLNEYPNPDYLNKAIEWFSSGEEQPERLELLQEQLRKTQAELRKAKDTIAAMETSKFWKLRTAWFKLKKSQ